MGAASKAARIAAAGGAVVVVGAGATSAKTATATLLSSVLGVSKLSPTPATTVRDTTTIVATAKSNSAHGSDGVGDGAGDADKIGRPGAGPGTDPFVVRQNLRTTAGSGSVDACVSGRVGDDIWSGVADRGPDDVDGDEHEARLLVARVSDPQ